jgi:hypothetical protein
VENRRAGIDYETCFGSIDSRLAGMEVRSTVMIWTAGINAKEGHAVVAIVQHVLPLIARS